MATTPKSTNIDYRLLDRLSNLVICSRCLMDGKVTPVPQVLSHRHTPRSLCPSCGPASRSSVRQGIARLVKS